MKKFFNFLFNFFWVISGGLISAIEFFVMGIITCVTIIPIFFGIPMIYFRAIPLVFAPAGKKVVLNFGGAPVRNFFWLILGGLVTCIFEFLLGVIMCCTIIGIPIGRQMFKFAKYMVAPFKAEVISF